MTLGIYLDKSGPDNNIKAVTVAGVIMESEQVGPFTEEWEAALHDFEELPFFHMSEYETGRGVYKEWYERQVKKPRLSRLLGIIEKHILAAFGTSVAIADCIAWSDETPLQSAYRIAASHCFHLIPEYRYLKERPAERVLYTFEEGDDGHGKLARVYDEILKEPWRREYSRLDGQTGSGAQGLSAPAGRRHPRLRGMEAVGAGARP